MMCEEAPWPRGLGHSVRNLDVSGSSPPPYRYMDLFSIVPSSTPWLRYVESQPVSLPPIGILIVVYVLISIIIIIIIIIIILIIIIIITIIIVGIIIIIIIIILFKFKLNKFNPHVATPI